MIVLYPPPPPRGKTGHDEANRLPCTPQGCLSESWQVGNRRVRVEALLRVSDVSQHWRNCEKSKAEGNHQRIYSLAPPTGKLPSSPVYLFPIW